MLMNIAICDDEKASLETLKYYLTQYSVRHPESDFHTTCFLSAKKLLKSFSNSPDYTVVFLDIEMPELNGIDLAEKILTLGNRNTLIVFVSSYPDYMHNSFRVHPFQFLVKPLSFENFEHVMNQIIENIAVEEKMLTILPLNDQGGKCVVHLDNIISIESTKKRRSLLFTLCDGRELNVHGTFSEWEHELADKNFLSPFRGVLINILHIKYIQTDCLTLDSGKKIPVSRRRQSEIHELFSRRLLKIRTQR